MQGNLRNEYNPARIYHTTVRNKHIRRYNFSDKELGKPNKPIKPVFIQPELNNVSKWWENKFVLYVVLLCLALLFTINFIFAIVMLVVGIFCSISESSNEDSIIQNDLNYKLQLEKYEKDLEHYEKVIIPEWELNKKPLLISEKILEGAEAAFNEACRSKGWRPLYENEINQEYIGKGEVPLFNALLKAPVIYAKPQVKIEDRYVADIVCLNFITGKMCIVEVDGSQHWSKGRSIQLDEKRMELVASKGVPTIRFINFIAEASPQECVSHIQALLE